MKKAIKWVIIVLLLLAVGLGLWWWLKPKDEPSYLTEPVKRTDIRQTVSATGEISAAQLVDVGAQASGQIKKAACENRPRSAAGRHDCRN